MRKTLMAVTIAWRCDVCSLRARRRAGGADQKLLTVISPPRARERDRSVDLMGEKRSVLDSGHPIRLAWMNGRSRFYAIADSYRPRTSAVAVAFNDHCDAVVATVVVAHDLPAVIEPSVIEFLNSQTVVHWAEVTLGL